MTNDRAFTSLALGRLCCLSRYKVYNHSLKLICSAWDDPEFVEAVLRLVLSRLVDSQLGIFAMLNFAISIYAVGALTTKVLLLLQRVNIMCFEA